MNTEKDRKELHDESNQGELEDDRNTGPVTNITPHVTNPSSEIILIWRIRSLCSNNNYIQKEYRERHEGINKALVTIAISPIGGCIVDHLLKYGACTIPELEHIIPTTKPTVSRTLNRLRIYGVVEKVGYVRSPYRLRNTPGPRISIYALKGADPQASIEAQKRYGDLVVSSRDLTLELERRQREAQHEARALEVKNLTDQVLNKLPRPHDRFQITPIYDTMNLVGVDQTLKEDVKAAVLSRIQEVEA